MKGLVVRIPRWYVVITALFFSGVFALSYPLVDLQTVGNGSTGAIFRGNPQRPRVAIACNVFWGEEFLPDMLQVLDQKRSRMTFFIGGSWAAKHPDLLKQIADCGHELGNHSYTHPHPKALTRNQNKEQIQRTEEEIFRVTAIRTHLYAPPYGEQDDAVVGAAAELGYKTIMWTADTIDWQRPPKHIIISRVMKKLQNGAIILIHPTNPTLQALPELIEQIHAAGYELVTVSEVLE